MTTLHPDLVRTAMVLAQTRLEIDRLLRAKAADAGNGERPVRTGRIAEIKEADRVLITATVRA